jgi:hypothetical protein
MMPRWCPVSLLLAGILFSYAAAAAPGAPGAATSPSRPSRFEQTKTFALTALDERLRILQRERQCVATVADSAGLRQCSAQASGARTAMKSRLHPQFERLRQAHAHE